MKPNTPHRLWHQIGTDAVLGELASNGARGLSSAEAAKRLQQYGPNALEQKTGHGPVRRFLLQFHQALVHILLVAVLIKLAVGSYADALVIFGVVFLNAVIGFLQEGKALGALAALARSLTLEASVLRDGEVRRIDASTLVPGDIVLLASGDKVPADVRLLRVRSLRVDEAALTGESVPVEKAETTLPEQTALAERSNMAVDANRKLTIF